MDLFNIPVIYKRILIIDDDADTLEVLKEVLSYEHFYVEALDRVDDIYLTINNCKPDLILTDYLLSGINGGEICYQVKSNPRTANLPVIIFSAYPRVLQSLGNYSCDAFIEKPFNLSDLLQQINRILSVTKYVKRPGLIYT